MMTMIAVWQKYVTKAIVWTLADKKDVEIMLNVNIPSTTPDVNAFQASLEIPSASVIHVSIKSLDYFSEYWNIKIHSNIIHTHNLFHFINLAPLPTSPSVVAGCTSDDDCPLYTACRDTRCINPCADENPCGRYASCRVINHRPECTCPDGFIGDPTTSCELRESPIFIYFLSILIMSTCACIEV